MQSTAKQIDGSTADVRNYSRDQLKRTVHAAAEKEWRVRVATSRRLKDSYSQNHTLTRRGYLSADFPGRQVLLKLRVDDLALGASRWTGLQQTVPACLLCKRGPETRQHFLLDCKALQSVRDKHGEAMRLCMSQRSDTAFKYLILAQPVDAADDVAKATVVGALMLDLWKERCMLLDIRMDLW